MGNRENIKKIGKELLRYRKKQFLLLQILIAILSFSEVCITVVMFNENAILGDGESIGMVIVGMIALICLFLLTIRSVAYVNFYIDKKNFDNLIRCGFTEKELITSIRSLGRYSLLKYILLGGGLGCVVGLMLTWKYKEVGSILATGIIISIIYYVSQHGLKRGILKVLRPINISKNNRDIKKNKKVHRLDIFDISLSYVKFNKKRVIAVGVIVFLGSILISYSLSMIQSISLQQYISELWGDANYKVTLNIDGDTTGDYYSMQSANPLTERMKQQILNVEGVRKVIPYYSIQAILNNGSEEIETCIEEINTTVKEKTRIEGLKENEIIISTRTSTFEEIKSLLNDDNLIVVEYFDGNNVKNKTCYVKDIIIDDSRNTVIYTQKEYIETMAKESLPILSFNIYGEENKDVYSSISKIISGKTLELQDKTSYVIESKKGLDFVKIGIIAIMIILMVFAVSVLLNIKLLNIIVRKKDFFMLQSLGMSCLEIKKIVLLESLCSGLPMILLSWILGIKMCQVTCKYMKIIGSLFWKFNPAYGSLVICLILLGIMICIEFSIYDHIVQES